MRYLLAHREMGIYVGSAMGLGFWTKLDSVDQPEVVTFPSPEEIYSFMSNWEQQPDHVNSRVIPTSCTDEYMPIEQAERLFDEYWKFENSQAALWGLWKILERKMSEVSRHGLDITQNTGLVTRDEITEFYRKTEAESKDCAKQLEELMKKTVMRQLQFNRIFGGEG